MDLPAMKRIFKQWLIGLQIGWIAFAGCHPTQPYFIRERADLAHYLDQAQRIEYPDLDINPLPEATQTFEPLTLDNQKFEFLDLSLEQCISYALANSKLIKTIPGLQRQNIDMAAAILSTPSQQLASVYDPALVATTTSPQQLAVDQNGNRILPRGAYRANQIGGVEDALSEFDAQFSAFWSYSNTDRPRNVGANNIFNPQNYVAKDGTGQMALSKRIATGGVVTARSQTIYSYNNIPVQSPSSPNNFGRAVPNDYTQILEFQVQHPLLRGRGTAINRIPVVLARINEDLSLVDFEERVRNVVRDVEYAYWDLYLAYWNVENARLARDSAAQAYHFAYEKLQKGSAGAAEAQAKYTFHDFQAQLDAALGGGTVSGADPGLFGRERNLRLLVGWAATDGRLIRPADKPSISLAQFDYYDALNETLHRSLDLRRQRWLIKQRELELVSSKNNLLPSLDASLIYRYLGVGGSWLNANGGHGNFPPNPGQTPPSSWETLLSGDYQEAAFRMDFTPNAVGARRASNDIRNKQLELAKATSILEEKEIAASHRISQVLGELNTNYTQMTEQLAALAAADRMVKLFQKKFDVGDSSSEQTMDLLLRAQQNRANAGRNYARALSEYNKSIADVHLLKGSLLEYNNITLEEGLWPDKAYWDAHERSRERGAAVYLANGASRPRIVSQGEFQQHQGIATSAVAAPKAEIVKPTPASKGNEEKVRETVPAMPADKPETPLKKASTETKPKFNWEKQPN
jgi:outer membrane protein TolC